ncbi:MAG: single-stranded DNA-binding protein [Betaproteobacteria bacterium]|nr:single-stranded DNA-binding protein [Betaproteobacteria bacterium]
MARLSVEIDDALLSRVLIVSQQKKIRLDTFIRKALDEALTSSNPVPVRKTLNVEDLIARAVDSVRNKEAGSEFTLVDLFSDEDWKTLSGGDRKNLGKGFRKAVEGLAPPIAKRVRRTSSNKAVYKKV